METSLLWLVGFPFLGSALLGTAVLAKMKSLNRFAGPFASTMLFLSFFNALRLAYPHLTHPELPATTADLGAWMQAGDLSIRAGLRLDSLSSVLVLIVSGIGLLIHIYSIGYMSHDENRGRYFTYLNLFCGFMLLLLTASSLPVLFIGWEGVGLCSFLLIGFWFTDEANAKAGKKAFVVNRIGDAGFIMGMALLYKTFGTLEVSALAAHPQLALAGSGVLELIAVLLFIGCVGKSAQFPLYIWLPDAMAGPTPVSALIHAATMVTAGVYVLARLSFLYKLTPVASEIVAVTGAFTAFFAATIALTQKDIKKVLAFSTVSQLGLMVLAMGVGAYGAGIFHLVTHAYFKALLFLAAGAVIHALHGEQKISEMGGLKNYIVGTTLTFFLGYLAIIGIPPFSGWFSKEEILHGVLASGHTCLFWIAYATAMLTVVYMTRLFHTVFLGVPRIPRQKLGKIHEAPGTMLLPMWLLAVLSFVGGMIPLPDIFPAASHTHETASWLGKHTGLFVTSSVLLTAFLTFKSLTSWRKRLDAALISLKSAPRLMEKEYFFNSGAVSFGRAISQSLSRISRIIDVHVIDALVNKTGAAVQGAAAAAARLQTGLPQVYALMILLGSVAIGWILLGRFL